MGDEPQRLEAAKWLLERGADSNLGRLHTAVLHSPEMAYVNGKTPLMDAAFYNRPALVRLLLQHGAKTEAHNGFGHTALIWAISQNSTSCVRELIAGGANVNVKYMRGRTALQTAQYYARKTGNNEIVDLLRQARRDGVAFSRIAGSLWIDFKFCECCRIRKGTLMESRKRLIVWLGPLLGGILACIYWLAVIK